MAIRLQTCIDNLVFVRNSVFRKAIIWNVGGTALLLAHLSFIPTQFAATAVENSGVAEATPSIHAVAEKPANKTILILDGSQSMWGQIEGSSKIAIAQRSINAFLDDWQPQQELGLTLYGHRRRGDCSDIEVAVAPAAATIVRIRKQVKRIKPQGRTPLSAAIRKAAEAANYKHQAASLILLSDGLEGCNLDPCETARSLKAASKNLVIHVVGFDITAKERANLSCIAEESGGHYFDADKGQDLLRVLRTVGGQITESRTKSPTDRIEHSDGSSAEGIHAVIIPSSPDATPAPTTIASSRGILSLSTLQAGAATSARSVSWKIYQLHNGVRSANTLPIEMSGPSLYIELPAGQWLVVAAQDGRELEQTFKISAGQVTQGEFNLAEFGPTAAQPIAIEKPSQIDSPKVQAAVAEAAAIPADEARPLSQFKARARMSSAGRTVSATWTVDRINATTAPERITKFEGSELEISLPPGRYGVTANHPQGGQQRSIEVTGANTVEQDFVLDIGELTLQLDQTGGQLPVKTVPWVLYLADTETPISNGVGGISNLLLAAGAYRLEIDYPENQLIHEFKIKAGAEQYVEFVLSNNEKDTSATAPRTEQP